MAGFVFLLHLLHSLLAVVNITVHLLLLALPHVGLLLLQSSPSDYCLASARLFSLLAPPPPSPTETDGQVLFVKQMSYKDIKNAIHGFQRVIYSNSNGVAYKARFDKGGGVSLVKEVKGFHQGGDKFHQQVQLLGRLNHRHILALKGFSTGNKRFLVFDNIENGSLEDYLRDPLKTPLNWKTRLQIAIESSIEETFYNFGAGKAFIRANSCCLRGLFIRPDRMVMLTEVNSLNQNFHGLGPKLESVAAMLLEDRMSSWI